MRLCLLPRQMQLRSEMAKPRWLAVHNVCVLLVFSEYRLRLHRARWQANVLVELHQIGSGSPSRCAGWGPGRANSLTPHLAGVIRRRQPRLLVRRPS
jgi:hypothetical protein